MQFLSTHGGTARLPIAVRWVSALGSGSLVIRTTRGEGLARSWGRASSVGGAPPKTVIFYLPTTLTKVLLLNPSTCITNSTPSSVSPRGEEVVGFP